MHVRERSAGGALALIGATAILLCEFAPARGQTDPAVAADVAAKADAATAAAGLPAVWVQKKVEFIYRGVTARYTCDGLQSRVKNVLLALGARSDVRVRTWNCTRTHAPERFPGVSIWMSVLQPAAQSAGQAIPAHWQKVDVLAHWDLVQAAADCELIQQVRQLVLPLFVARDVDYAATCQPHGLLVGSTKLSAEVLVPDGSATAQTASR